MALAAILAFPVVLGLVIWILIGSEGRRRALDSRADPWIPSGGDDSGDGGGGGG